MSDVLGIDVSRYQASEDGSKRFDWAKAAPKIYFAFIRASVGAAGVDFQLYYNLQESKRQDVPVGLYHYLKPEKDWKKQADVFASLAVDGQSGKPAGQLPPVVDVEETGGLSKAALGSYVEKFVMRFEAATGLSMIVYTSPGFWDAAMPLTNWAKNRRLWVANYDVTAPRLPKEWGECNNPRPWSFWQFTSKGPGFEYGSGGDDDIDLNYYNGTLADLNREFGLTVAPHPDPDPDPEPQPNGRVSITVNNTNIRCRPEITPSTDVGDLKTGTQFEVVADLDPWLAVKAYVWKRNTKPV